MALNNRLSKTEPDPGATAATASGDAVAMTRLQRTIARRMVIAKTEIPEFTTEVEVDMSAVGELREERRRQGRAVPSYNDFVIAASAAALRAVPKLNSSFAPDGIVYHERVNVGVAVASDGALVVPTVFDADRKSVEEIAGEVKALAGKVKDSSLKLEEMADQTFTVSNLGMHGVSRFTAIVSPPQVGILALGAVREVLVPDSLGAPVAQPQMAAVLSADHRVVYGAEAAQFLAAFRSALEQPSSLDRTNDLSGTPA
jgi:pyruvate dehydrogenase E2 component (dihydrolipoyllysine-residue acetyltransferase)